jgi:magnesium transporter
MTATEAISYVRMMRPESETVYYLFVVDRADRLCGVVSLRQLIVADPDALIDDIMDPDVIYVEVGADQEECARLIAWYDLLALPVVDQDMRLLGVITVDDLVDVLEEEATEDLLRLSGSVGEPEEADSLVVQAAKRLPWLLVAIGGEMITANVIMGFEIILSRIVALAFFIPVIMATAGNVGTQSLAGMVRGITLGEADVRDVAAILWREARVGVMLGVTCGLVVGVLARLWGQQPVLGLVVGVSMAIALVIAAALGGLIPLVLKWFKRDPAYASGPFISAINDVTSITIYFLLATLLMERMV